jgi:hypothetical protein
MISVLILCTFAALSQFAALRQAHALGLRAYSQRARSALPDVATIAIFQAAAIGLLVAASRIAS